MKDYLNVVLSKINNKNHREMIAKELEAHIEDRIEYYVNAGYNRETAEAKANEQMGDTAEFVGDQLNLLHKSKLNVFITVILLLLSVVLIFDFCGYSIIERDTILSSRLGLQLSSSCLLIAFLNLFTAIVIKSRFLALASSFMLLAQGISARGFEPSIFYFCEMLKGNRENFSDFFHLFIWKCDNPFINAVCILFLAVCFVLSICVFVHICKFKKLKNGINFYKNEKVLKIFIVIFASFVLSVFIIVLYHQPYYQNDFSRKETYYGFYILESDEKAVPENIENTDTYIRANYYDFCDASNIYTEGCRYSSEEYWKEPYSYSFAAETEYKRYADWSRDVLYLKGSIKAEFKTDKKYVVVVPMLRIQNEGNGYDYVPDFDNSGQWTEVSEGTILSAGDRDYKYNRMLLDYEIKVIPE